MIDQNEVLLITEPILTPEHIAKTDKDIATLSALSDYAASKGSVLEIAGGYALEAHFGGKITRSHGDMDAVLWLSDTTTQEAAREEITNILFQESTPWAEYPNVKNRKNFIEFREVAPEKQFLDSRRLELYMFDRKKMRPLVEKVLIDSGGQEHKIMVTTIEELVADKVRIFNRTEDERKNKRPTKQSDIDEFIRIIGHKDFNKGKYLKARSGALRYFDKTLTEEQAVAIAEEQWQIAMQIVSSLYSQNPQI